MAACEWHEDADGFRYLVTDYRGAATQEELAAVFVAGSEAAQVAVGRVAMVVVSNGGDFDPGFFKGVKDHNNSAREDNVRVALVGFGGRGRAVAAMLNVRLTHERARSFDDEEQALAWLKEQL